MSGLPFHIPRSTSRNQDIATSPQRAGLTRPGRERPPYSLFQIPRSCLLSLRSIPTGAADLTGFRNRETHGKCGQLRGKRERGGLLKRATPLRGKPHKGNPPYPPLSGGQEKAKPPLPGGGASPFYTPLTRGGRGGCFWGGPPLSGALYIRQTYMSGLPFHIPRTASRNQDIATAPQRAGSTRPGRERPPYSLLQIPRSCLLSLRSIPTGAADHTGFRNRAAHGKCGQLRGCGESCRLRTPPTPP